MMEEKDGIYYFTIEMESPDIAMEYPKPQDAWLVDSWNLWLSYFQIIFLSCQVVSLCHN